MQVVAAGYTIAPMASKYVASGQPSPECLVTLVIKMDLRGWLGERSPMAWALSPFGWTHAIVNSFLEPMLMSLISLRDKVWGLQCTVWLNTGCP